MQLNSNVKIVACQNTSYIYVYQHDRAVRESRIDVFRYISSTKGTREVTLRLKIKFGLRNVTRSSRKRQTDKESRTVVQSYHSISSCDTVSRACLFSSGLYMCHKPQISSAIKVLIGSRRS